MENKNKGLIITIIVLVICLLGTCGYIAYDKLIKKEESKQEENKTEEKREELNKITSPEIDALGMKLFEMINFDDGWTIFGHYLLLGDALSIDNISRSTADKIVLLSLFRKISSYDTSYNANACHNSDFYNTVYEGDKPIKECLLTTISKDSFSNEYYKFFGRKITDFSNIVVAYPDEGVECQLSDDGYKCYQRAVTLGDDAECTGRYNYVSSYMINNDLFVRVDAHAENCSYDIDPVKYAKEYGENYIITFKKNSNSDWYWYSTEKVS